MKKRIYLVVAALLAAVVLLSGCDNAVGALAGIGGFGSYGDYEEGRMGDVMETAFFDFTVTSAVLTDEYDGRTASDGMRILVCEIKIKNTTGDVVPMWAHDFYAYWGYEDDEMAPPLEAFNDEMVEDEYELKRAETRTILSVYEVPESVEEEYSIGFLEYYEDESTGTFYDVYLDPEER